MSEDQSLDEKIPITVRQVTVDKVRSLLTGKKPVIGLKRAKDCSVLICTTSGHNRLLKTTHPVLKHNGLRKLVVSDRELKRLIGRKEMVSYFGI